VRAENLAQAADELYGLDPAEFRAARDERASQARAAGDAELGAAIRKLRRPTVSAWLVNWLVRETPDEVGRLLELGESLREAQQSLAGDRLRELSAQRRQLVRELTQEAKRLAAQARRPVSDTAEREVEATLEAALADPAAAAAVRSGRLTTGLVYAGMGGIDMADAVAVPAAPPGRARRPAADSPPGRTEGAERQQAPEPGTGQAAAPAAGRADTGGRGPRLAGGARETEAERRKAREDAGRKAREDARQAAQRGLGEAEAAAEEAKAALDEAERELAEATQQHADAGQRIEDLEQRLDTAHAVAAQAARTVREARRRRDVASRSADSTQRRLTGARAKLDGLR
jgi:hypothetical protein